ncbi:MAG: pyruvate formate-lyase-activating protein [Marinisporobacter sp.]|nr:pyruvate formate-lyase-activating protein [Marinisporobacter sp.]
MTITGKIHSVETCGTVDGPGIRYVLFLSGCPLRCKYCHNPDTWASPMYKSMTIDEVMGDVKKYKPYFSFSKGGITLSGGEATLQWEFVEELFKACKDEKIHTCLDTSGYCDLENAEKFLAYTDLVLLDIKQINNKKHKELTGVDNTKILQFAKYLNEKNIPTWIRYVLVPEYSDDEEDVDDLCQFLKDLNNVEKVEVIPYHEMGVAKWEELNLTYSLKHIKPPTRENIERIKKIFLKYNLPIAEDEL